MNASVRSPRPGLARRALEDLPNLFSLLVFFGVTAILFRSWEFALIVTASLGFHELGHAALLAYFRLDWRITFGLAGAWTWSPLAGRARLSQFANTTIHLAGPFFSLLLAMIALGLHLWLTPDSQHLLLLANFSAQVGFLNLLPLGPLTDGGKVVRRMIDSLEETVRAWAVLLPMLVSALALLIYTLAELPRLGSQPSSSLILGLLLVGLWMGSSLLIESRRQRVMIPNTGSPHTAAADRLTRAQAILTLVVFWDLLALGMIIIAETPFWLAPEYLLGSLENMIAVLLLLAQVPL